MTSVMFNVRTERMNSFAMFMVHWLEKLKCKLTKKSACLHHVHVQRTFDHLPGKAHQPLCRRVHEICLSLSTLTSASFFAAAKNWRRQQFAIQLATLPAFSATAIVGHKEIIHVFRMKGA